MQPLIQNNKTARETVSAFGGLWARPDAREGYFLDVLDTSSRRAPALSPRPPRGISDLCADFNGMHAHGQMCWADGTSLYYDSAYVGEVADSEKTFVSMGAYILIFPDKRMLNTETGALTDMEHTVTISGVAIAACDLDGSLNINGVCARLSAMNIGLGFRAGDVVEITGSSNDALNGSFYLNTVERDRITITCDFGDDFVEALALTVARLAPDMDYVCEMNNRVWGCSSAKHEVYACRLGDPTNWRDYRGLSTDSYAATVASAGDFTGACAYLGYVLFFKEDEILKLYGSKPQNFELISARMSGVEAGSGRSLAIVNQTLYYKSADGVCAYDGAYPTLVSQALGEKRYSSACAGAIGGRYYVSMKDVLSDEWKLFVYDEAAGAWHRESAPEARVFVNLYGDLFFLGADGRVMSVGGTLYWYDHTRLITQRAFATESRVNWYAETGDILLALPDKKYVTKLQIRLSIGEDASVKVYVQYAPGSWALKKVYDASAPRTVVLPIRPHRGDTMRVRLAGYGDCTVEAVTKTYERGSDR